MARLRAEVAAALMRGVVVGGATRQVAAAVAAAVVRAYASLEQTVGPQAAWQAAAGGADDELLGSGGGPRKEAAVGDDRLAKMQEDIDKILIRMQEMSTPISGDCNDGFRARRIGRAKFPDVCAMQQLKEFDGLKLKSVAQVSLGIDDVDEKKQTDEANAEFEPLTKLMDEVKHVQEPMVDIDVEVVADFVVKAAQQLREAVASRGIEAMMLAMQQAQACGLETAKAKGARHGVEPKQLVRDALAVEASLVAEERQRLQPRLKQGRRQRSMPRRKQQRRKLLKPRRKMTSLPRRKQQRWKLKLNYKLM